MTTPYYLLPGDPTRYDVLPDFWACIKKRHPSPVNLTLTAMDCPYLNGLKDAGNALVGAMVDQLIASIVLKGSVVIAEDAP